MCDVGQGDALLINLGGGNAALFDAGPEPELLDRCLSQFNISALPRVVLSHRHADHVNGIKGVGDREIGQVWSNQEDPIYGALPNLSLTKEGTSAVS